MGQTISSVLKEGQDDENVTTFLERRKATSPYYGPYNTRKATFTTNSQGMTAPSINHSMNMEQKLSSVEPRKETSWEEEKEDPTSWLHHHQNSLNEITTQTTLGKKVETAPFIQPYNVVAQSRKKEEISPSIQPCYNTLAQKTTSLMSESTISPLYRSVTSSYKRNELMTPRERERRVKKGRDILKILQHLVSILRDNDEDVIYGFWQCEKLEERDLEEPGWEEELSLDVLQKCLNKTPEDIYESFKKNCIDYTACRKEHLITSFRKYTRSRYLDEEPDLEIICHLLWNDYYRVYGEFKCRNCWKKWRSAYIWISFQKFIEKIPGPRLRKNDFYMQNCKKCKAGENDESFILLYEPLKTSGGVKPHKVELCAKCQNDEYCRQTGTYLGKNVH
ncbi:11147_t:CDS:2 [Funneliformis caledonium]|uniref:11147_t:CDS:1 n=1 Tax=Funneliformis caledonium TaxID=1117310 RepID=A0A9N9FIE4_9GLOM|nr:11147_t:CDS:2 [Funneliformis caledonium]